MLPLVILCLYLSFLLNSVKLKTEMKRQKISLPYKTSHLRTNADINRNGLREQIQFIVAYLISYVWLFATPWTVAAHQAPLSMGFSRQEYWSGLPCPPPGDLPNPGMEPRSPALQADSFYHLSYQGSPCSKTKAN